MTEGETVMTTMPAAETVAGEGPTMGHTKAVKMMAEEATTKTKTATTEMRATTAKTGATATETTTTKDMTGVDDQMTRNGVHFIKGRQILMAAERVITNGAHALPMYFQENGNAKYARKY